MGVMARVRKVAVWLGGGVVAAGALAVGAYAYDSARDDVIAKGVRVAAVDVGGLTSGEARTRLRIRLAPRLRQPVTVRAAGHRYRLDPRHVRLAADMERMVAAALDRSRSSALPTRVWRSITGGRVEAAVPARVSYSRAPVERFVRRVERAVDRRPRNASVELASPTLPVGRARSGLDLDRNRLRAAVERAMRSTGSARTVTQRPKVVQPRVTKADLVRKYPHFITIDRSSFRLRFFKRLKLVKTYRIGVGRAGFETPSGLYHVQNKAVNPSWFVPDKPWAGSLAGKVIPPGPDNPIKARWMGIYDGAGIHGTSDTASIGTAASHGCIRMLIPEVEELYDRVPVRTPIYIT
jgi:lipoprotein-anchoring transpeptidase ErfK/SrfK